MDAMYVLELASNKIWNEIQYRRSVFSFCSREKQNTHMQDFQLATKYEENMAHFFCGWMDCCIDGIMD